MNDDIKRLHAYVRILKKELPAAYPVSINFVSKKISVKDDDCFAATWLDLKKKKFFIQISKSKCYRCMLDSLIHEYAHILDWSHLHDKSEEPEYHSSTWGVWYSKVYRFICREK